MKIKRLHPLISCICVTGHRTEMLLKAIISFDQQNYPNRELVVSYPENDDPTRKLISKLSRISELDIVVIERRIDETIGTARNNAVTKSNGEYICMWDDDDHYSFNRLADQHNFMQGQGRYFQASILIRILLYDSKKNKAFISLPNYWTGSLLCKKIHFLDHPCADNNIFECDSILEFLRSKKILHEVDLKPSLYTFIYHGGNVLNYTHFQYYTSKSRVIDQEHAESIRIEMEQKALLTEF